MSTKELVKALRCSATPGGAESCAGCSYRVVEQVSDEDAAKYGIAPGAEFESCDTDRIALDAADLLEKLNAERDAAVSDLTDMVNEYRRETSGTDFCGLCEYDLPPAGENGQMAECPGFYRDDCFKWRGLEGRTE